MTRANYPAILLILILSLAPISSRSVECYTCEKKENFYDYAKKVIDAYNQATCSPSLIAFELKSPLTHDQRCQLISDLNILRNISFSKHGEEFQKIFSPKLVPEKSGQELYHWLVERIKSIYFIDSTVSTAINYGLCERTGVCNDAYERGEIGLDDSYFKKQTPIERILVLIHEARHTDGHDFLNGTGNKEISYDTLHTSCDRYAVSLGGTASDRKKVCDNNLDGSIGTTMTVLGNIILHCSSCFDLVELGDAELNDYYLQNLYNSELTSINHIDFDLSRPIN
jgi:hypothetical protein